MGEFDGHRDRLRARFLREGLSGFEQHTALELLLFYARPRCDTDHLARDLIRRFGGFAAVIDAPLGELEKVPGLGRTSAVLLKMIPELGAYYLDNRAEPGAILDSTGKAGEFFLARLFGKQNEEAHMVALDDKRKVIRAVCLSREGIVNAVRITIKRVVAEALNTNATGVILAHNHPSGLALPSSGDKAVTRQVYQALRLINVNLIDHIVVADGDFVSLADSGYMELLRRDAIENGD